MAPRQEGEPDPDEEDRARLRKKLDGYEAMGLKVGGLRDLLDIDLERFKETYLEVIKRQLEGKDVEEGPPEPAATEEATVGPDEDEEELEEEMELQLEGAGPEEALTAPEEEPDEEPTEEVAEEAPGAEPEEDEIEISVSEEEAEEPIIGEEPEEEEAEVPSDEVKVPEEGAEEEEAEEEVTEEEEAEEEVTEEEEAEEEEVKEEVTEEEEAEEEVAEEEVAEEEVAEEEVAEEEVAEEEEAEEEVGEVPELEAEEEELGEMEVTEEVPEEEAEEKEEEEEEKEEAPEEEALIVLATVVEEEGPEEEAALEEETEILLEGIYPEAEAEEEEEGPEEEAPAEPRPPKAVKPRPRPKAVAKPPAKPPTKARAKAPPAKPKAEARPKVEARPKTVRRRRRGLNREAVAAMVVALLVVGAAGAYFTIFQNSEPTAVFTFAPEDPVEGELVTFDASSSSDPDDHALKYTWRFGDGASRKGKRVSHAFLSSESFTVTLTVEDERGAQRVTRRTVDVGPLTISMEEPLIDDHFQYDVEGNVSLWNPAGALVTFKEGALTYSITAVDAGIGGTKTLTVVDVTTAKDGFMKVHDVRLERTVYDLQDVEGTITTNAPYDPYFTGKIYAEVDDHMCLEWERGVTRKALVTTSFQSAGYDVFSSRDEGTFYAQLDGIESTFSMNEFLRSNEFVSNDRTSNTLTVGSSKYIWKVLGMERVQGRSRPALHINVTMDAATLSASRLDAFYTDIWLEEGLSQPAKNHVHAKGWQDGNRYIVDMTETLAQATQGAGAATGVCSGDHLYNVTEEHQADFKPLDHVPERGGTAGGFIFSPEEALQAARDYDDDLDLWISERPTAFLYLGNYTESDGEGKWVMTFGHAGSSDQVEVTVQGTPGSLSIAIDRDPDVGGPIGTATSVGRVVTLSRGVRLLRNETQIRSRCFLDTDPNWNTFTFNVTEGVSSLSLDPVDLLSRSVEGDYTYLLVSRDGGKYKAALDATNGQVLFSWEHTHRFRGLQG